MIKNLDFIKDLGVQSKDYLEKVILNLLEN